jgi:hypothetical protein
MGPHFPGYRNGGDSGPVQPQHFLATDFSMLRSVFGWGERNKVVLVIVVRLTVLVVDVQANRKAVNEPMFVTPNISALADPPPKLNVPFALPVAPGFAGRKWLVRTQEPVTLLGLSTIIVHVGPLPGSATPPDLSRRGGTLILRVFAPPKKGSIAPLQ